ncbi:MAG: PDZ domain-containing protein [Acidobacteria bacterium]|nr:PDZ domain-containing protein [Acidobacteriota bacterium]
MKKLIFIMLMLAWIALGAQAPDRIDSMENEIRIVLEKVSPSLVKVVAENHRKYVATGIALENGLVITTALVTRHPFEKIFVETVKGEAIMARIAGQDDRSGLTLLRLDKKGLPPLRQARQAEVGNWVALVGLFYDRFPAIFQGIVSSLSENELLLNAPVAPGAAGGAVVNKKGELLGIIRGSVGFSFTPDLTFKDQSAAIVVSGSKSASGRLCYAIPIEQVKRIAGKLKSGEKLIPGWLGITVDSDANQVLDAYKGSPAAKAGIIVGDRIEELAGRPVSVFRDIAAALQYRYAGEKVMVRIDRAGKKLRLDVELGDRQGSKLLVLKEKPGERPPRQPLPPPAPGAPETIDESDLPHLAGQLAEIPDMFEMESALPMVKNYVIEFHGARQLGVDVMEITADLGRKFGVSEGHGLLVSQVNKGSAADKAGMQAGDVIVRAKGAALRNPADLRQALNSLKEKEAVLLELYRDGRLRKFQLVPDRNDKMTWDIKRFAQKVENLKSHIGEEAEMIYRDELKKLQQSKEKSMGELQRQKELSLLKLREESRKIEAELKKLQDQKETLGAETHKKFAEELKKIHEELKKLQEKIRSEDDGGAAGDGAGR